MHQLAVGEAMKLTSSLAASDPRVKMQAAVLQHALRAVAGELSEELCAGVGLTQLQRLWEEHLMGLASHQDIATDGWQQEFAVMLQLNSLIPKVVADGGGAHFQVRSIPNLVIFPTMVTSGILS